MEISITQEEIGSRVGILRKNKGLSQEDLAKRIGISRSSITQIELGKRSLSAIEMHQISIELGFSIDEFLADKLDMRSFVDISNNQKEISSARIALPQMNIKKFENVLLYLLERCAGKPNVGETLIYKLLYFSDFNYYELHEEHLSGAIYRKLPFGPVPKNLDAIINRMIERGDVKRMKTKYHGYFQTRYIPLKKADLMELKASEKEVLDKVIAQFSDWSAKALSEYSHKDVPWLASKEGKEINYELVFYREAPFSVRNYNSEL